MYAGELDAPFFEFEERESPFVAMMRAGEDDPKAERFMSGGGPASRDDEGGDLRRGDGVAGGLCSAATLSKHRFACIQKRVRRALLQAGDEGRENPNRVREIQRSVFQEIQHSVLLA